jgi:hypothetical protein
MRYVLTTALLLSLALFTGCESPKEPQVNEDTYTSFAGVRGKWEVNSEGPVKVEIQDGKDGVKVINVTGKRATSNPATRVKVSGEGITFNLYEIERVIVDPSAVGFAYSCGEVVARENAVVHVWSCPQVKLMPGAKAAENHGDCNITQLGAKTQGQ